MGREAGQDPGQREASGRPGRGEEGRDAANGNQEGHLTPHVQSRDEETERHPDEERQEGGAEEDADAHDPKVREGDGHDESEGRRCQEEGDVEDRVAHVHSEEGLPKSHREDPGHGDHIVPRPVRPLQILASEESERAHAEAVQEDARMEEEDRIPEGRVREQAFARDRDREAEPGDDDREGEERRSSGVARMDPELLRQHEAEQPDHPHAPTMRRKAASRFDSGPRISSTLPVATIAPSWITATRSHSFSAMSSRWEAMKTVPPPPM